MPVGIALIDPGKIFEKVSLSDGMRVADFGCGRTGHITFSVSPLVGERGVVYALDIMKDVLESITSQSKSGGYGNIHPVWTDLEKVGAAPIPEGSLDAGFFINVMFMLKNRSDALREAARLIKADGYLVVVDWEKKLGPLGPMPEQMVPKDKLVVQAENEGFSLTEEVSLNAYHFCEIFRKKKV